LPVDLVSKQPEQHAILAVIREARPLELLSQLRALSATVSVVALVTGISFLMSHGLIEKEEIRRISTADRQQDLCHALQAQTAVAAGGCAHRRWSTGTL
jgi:hypothetical protein